MFGSTTAPSLSPSPDFSSRCALCVSGFSSLSRFRSGASSDPRYSSITDASPLNFSPLTFNIRLLSPLPATLASILPRRCEMPFLSPLFATLTDHSQLAENSATLSPFAATLTGRVKHKSFACHSYEKHRGVGYALHGQLDLRKRTSGLPDRHISLLRFSLSPVKLLIRRLKEVLRRSSIGWIHRHANAHANRWLFLVVPHASFDAFRHVRCHFLIGIDQHHCKFVAPVSCRQVRRPAFFFHDPRQPLQRLISRQVPKPVIDPLQVVHIQKQRGERMVTPFGPAQFALQG